MSRGPSDIIREWLPEMGWRSFEADSGKRHEDELGVYWYAGWEGDNDKRHVAAGRYPEDFKDWDPSEVVGTREYCDKYFAGEYGDPEHYPQYDDDEKAAEIQEYFDSLEPTTHARRDGSTYESQPWAYFLVAPDGFFTNNIYEAAFYQDTKLGGM